VFPVGSTSWGEQVLSGQISLFGLAASPEPVHPTQLYEIAAAVACAALALFLGRRGALPGIPALAFAAGFVLFRGANQLLRAPLPTLAVAPDLIVLLYFAAAAVLAGILAWRLRAELELRPALG
jgi:phosphatidylglycerol:prolipoprotein diacylglycerol transferase